MKNKKEISYKTISNLFYIAALCFFIASIINYLNKEISTGVIFSCLGATNLCS